MKYWAVPIHVDATGHCVVAAKTEQEAMDLALEGFFVCDDNTELGDAISALEPTELTKAEYEEQKRKGRAIE